MIRPLLATLLMGSLVSVGAPALVPLPVSVESGQGGFALTTTTSIRAQGEAAKEAEKWAQKVRGAMDLALPVGEGSEAGIRFSLKPGLREDLGSEGYRLRVSKDGVDAVAAEAAGLFYAGETLRQLLPTEVFGGEAAQDVVWLLPSVEIVDRPRFAWRGFMLDESRHFFGKDYVKQLIDVMASQKLNVFHWHLTDDDGWRVEIKSWPKLTEVGAWRGTECAVPNTRKGEEFARYGGFYTQEEIREIVAYAADRHVQILPEIDLPGHCLAVTTAYPETMPTVMNDTVSAQGVKKNAITPAREENFAMIDDILGEIADLFPFGYVHVGGDEVNHSLWKECPEIKALMEREKLKNLSAVQNYFTRRLEKILEKHDRRMIGWNEVLGGGNLRADTTVMAWIGTGPGFSAARKGHPVIMAPGPYNYFDMSYPGPGEPKSHWWAGKVDTSKTYSFNPTAGGDLSPEEQARIMGPHSALWTEFVLTPEMADYKIFPRLTAFAEVAWTPQKARDWEGFSSRLGAQLERLHRQGVAFRVPPPTATWKKGVVTIHPPFPNAEVRFTTDGNAPTVKSSRYEKPLTSEDPSSLRYLTVFHERTSPVHVGAEREAFAKWTPKMLAKDWKVLEFDASAVVTADGVHRVRFEFSGGRHKLLVRDVALLRDGKVVAEDAHAGETGSRHLNNLWRLPVTGHGADAHYTLRAEVKGDGGTNSHGGISLERSLHLEPTMKAVTKIPHYGDHGISKLTDWNAESFFWSNRALKAGDSIDFVFEIALPLKHVALPTGEARGTKDQIQNAVLEVSSDGKNFREVAKFSYGKAAAALDGAPIKALRFRVTGAHETWCIVRAPELK